jgi:flagellin-specific chaperone FliS
MFFNIKRIYKYISKVLKIAYILNSFSTIKKIIKQFEKCFEDLSKNILRKIPPKVIPKAGRCGSCYPVCTPTSLYN